MHRQHFDAFAFSNLQCFHHIDALVVPADTALEGQGNVYVRGIEGCADIVQDLLQAGEVAQQSRTATLARDLGSGAACVHLDEFRMQGLGDFFGGCCHPVGETSENLDAERAFFREKLQLLVPVKAEDCVAVGRDEFGNQDAHSVARKDPAESAERGVRHPVHGTEDRVRKDFQISKLETFQHFNHIYPQKFRNKNPKKLFNFSGTGTLTH